MKKTGQPIGINDLPVAAHARSEGLTLVSNNRREFERVPGLMLDNWVLIRQTNMQVTLPVAAVKRARTVIPIVMTAPDVDVIQ